MTKTIVMVDGGAYNARGVSVTTYQDNKGASAAITDGPTPHLTLRDSDLKIDYEAHSAWDSHRKGSVYYNLTGENIIMLEDRRVTCADGAVNVIDDVAASVMRNAIQSFGKEHPELVSRMRESNVVLDHVGEDKKALTFAGLLDTPSHFRACPPERANENIRVEKLNKSR